ncbi:GPI ethanolamine phosphate transferase 1 [Helicoverpa armigera]|uniref:GPI ethanolamine phosphate transferase 1 n=1 Tax=Helicoverpa armigera TaxID=29058 RepID=UPI0030839505
MFFVGLFVHFVFLFSIFDIYFKSPIVKNVEPYQPRHEHLAERLVLFVVDGLRAESFLNYTTMPYLRSVANSYGRWGISNTQVPTESRPGHVAVIAGFYEDPSAVAKGWKENPVDFDSVFNQTFYTWCWGTYDIVNIFTKANIDDHIVVHDFDPYDQSFSTDKNTTLLDAWVFDKVKNFFHDAKSNDILKEKLQSNKIIFFLHLLGTDTAGHTHKPKTQNFLSTLKYVDEGIKEIEQVIRDYYGDDGKTTFLMTSDHGMTDWGSHGAGDDHETQTPYVIWGSGVKQTDMQQEDPETIGMSLDHRLDINQVDLSPIMSTILSIPVPVNSRGKLTTELFDMTLSNKAKAIYSNSRQLASQYNKKRLDVEEHAIAYIYQPYEPFSKAKYQELIEFTEKLVADEDYEKLIMLSEEIIHLSLSGLTYYHNYYQQPLLILVTLSFLGWIACLLRQLSEQRFHTQTGTSILKSFASPKKQTILDIISAFLCFVSVYLVCVQHLPLQYNLYTLMPIFLWWYALSSQSLWLLVKSQFRKNRNTKMFLIQVVCYTLGSVALGLSFTYRWMLSIPLVGMAVWPFLSSTRHQLTKPVLVAWPVGCLLLSVFSFMPVVGKNVNIDLVITAGIIWLIATMLYIYKILLPLCSNNDENNREIVLSVIQAVLLMTSLHNIYVQSKRFEQGTPVLHSYQALAWVTAVLCLVLPLLFTRRLICRLMAINTSILNFYLLLSVSHEGLFIVALIMNLMCWIFIEFRLKHAHNMKLVETTFEKDNSERKKIPIIEREICGQDFRRAYFCVLYIILAFFGTGNIASLNSFEVRWVTCFITSFQPFIITTLILLKTLAPILSVGCCFRAVQHLTKAPAGYLNIMVLIFSNLMGVQLLYNVKNTGSWLEIGTSISQFVIVQVITLFIVIINQIATSLTDLSIYSLTDKLFKSRKKYV